MGLGRTLGVYLKAISSSGSLLLLLLLYFHGGENIIGASAASSPPESGSATKQECDKVVMVETPELLSYLGNVTFTVPSAYKGRWTTVIKFTTPFTFIGGWGVTVQTFGRKAYAIFERNEEENLKTGDEVIFQFRVLYGYGVKVPKVLSIKWQNKIICGPPIQPDSKLLKTFAKLELDSSSEEEEEEEPVSDDSTVQGSQDDGRDEHHHGVSTISSGPSNVEVGKIEDDGIQHNIEQHVASNRVRINKWKPIVKKG